MTINDATKPAASGWAAARALAVFALIAVLFFFRALPFELEPMRGANAANQFDTERALSRLSRVLDGKPHAVDSAALDETRARLIKEIRALGYSPEVRSANSCLSLSGTSARCAFVQNVFFVAGPTANLANTPAVVVSAHYDTVEASPGFADDGIGVAVWLEIAHHLKQSPPKRPVVFLLTDGEEPGLLGAQTFLKHQSDYPFKVGRIINLEARGVRGPAFMFQTGHPNAGVVRDWSKNGARPFSNSMLSSVYELMPNSTDLTAHLDAGFNGVNIAISDGLDFYHTTHDDLAHLNRASVQHMGDQALGATRAFIAGDWAVDAGGGEIAYADVASRFFVAAPQSLAVALLGLCLVVAAVMLVRPTLSGGWRTPNWSALILPPVFLLAAGGAVFGLQQLIAAIRPEVSFWAAYPQAFNMAIFLVTSLVGAMGLSWLAPRATREAIYASGWFWLLLVGLGLSIAMPGVSMLFLIPGVVFVVMGLAAWVLPRLQMFFYAIASVVLALIFFPIIHLLDVMMGLAMAAVFSAIEALVLAPMFGLIGGVSSGRLKVVGVVGVAAIAAVAATILAPAYSVEHPMPLNIQAHYDLDAKKAAVFANAPAASLPTAVGNQLALGQNPSPPGSQPNLASKSIPFAPPAEMTAKVVSVTTSQDGKRTIRLQVTAPKSRQARLRIPGSANPIAVKFRDADCDLRSGSDTTYVVDVVGRAAADAVIDITLAPASNEAATKPAAWVVQSYWTDLPKDAAQLVAARPNTAIKIGTGDVSIASTTLTP